MQVAGCANGCCLRLRKPPDFSLYPRHICWETSTNALPTARPEKREDKEVFLTVIIMASAAESVKMFSTRCGGKLHWLANPPDCPGGGIPPGLLGNLTKMESTAALFPKQGSKAMGLGTDCEKGEKQLQKCLHQKMLWCCIFSQFNRKVLLQIILSA